MSAEDGDEEEWRFSLEDLAEEEEEATESEGNVAGSLSPRGEIEPGEIDPENAFFVLLGVVLTSLLVFSAVRFALGL